MLHYKKLVAGGIVASLLTGCATMLPHYRLSNDYTKALGMQVAVSETCAEHGHLDRGTLYQLGYGTTELLEVAVANESLYKEIYKEGIREAKTMSPIQIKNSCEEFKDYVPTLLSRLNNNYRSAVEARSMGAISLNSALADFNNSMQSFNNSMAMQNSNMSRPNTQPDLGTSQQQNPKLYLINTPEGQQQCTMTSSGYVHCY
ncbi:MAG: hypothetical protein ABR539_11550 [Halomonas sp.]